MFFTGIRVWFMSCPACLCQLVLWFIVKCYAMQTSHKELLSQCCLYVLLLSLIMMEPFLTLFFVFFLSLQLACSGTMPCPSSTSSISCSSRSSRSPRAQRCRVRSASDSHAWLRLPSQHRRAGLLNPNQPFSGGPWHRAGIGTKFSL